MHIRWTVVWFVAVLMSATSLGVCAKAKKRDTTKPVSRTSSSTLQTTRPVFKDHSGRADEVNATPSVRKGRKTSSAKNSPNLNPPGAATSGTSTSITNLDLPGGALPAASRDTVLSNPTLELPSISELLSGTTTLAAPAAVSTSSLDALLPPTTASLEALLPPAGASAGALLPPPATPSLDSLLSASVPLDTLLSASIPLDVLLTPSTSLAAIPSGTETLDNLLSGTDVTSLDMQTSEVTVDGTVTSAGATLSFEEGLPEPDMAALERYVQNPGTKKLSMNLEQIVMLTLCRNLNIRLRNIENRIAHDEFHAQEGIFDLQISGRSQLVHTETLGGSPSGGTGTGTSGSGGTGGSGGTSGSTSGTSFTGAMQSVLKTTTFDNSISVGQLLPTGGMVELLFQDTRTKTNAPGTPTTYNATAGVQLRQPLLRNGGALVTQSRIIIAQYQNFITVSQLRQQVMQEISNAIQTYYELIFATSNVEVLRVSLAQANELLRVNTEKYRAGVLPELDVLQAQAQVASREDQIVTALQQVEIVSDTLKNQFAQICELRECTLRPADRPSVPTYKLDEPCFLDQALAYRPEYEQTMWDIETQNMNRMVAQNQTLPQLDTFAGYSQSGVAQSNSQAIDNAEDGQLRNWRVGVEFSYPLQNRTARYRFHQTEEQLQAAYTRQEQLRNNIFFDVRNGVRGVRDNLRRVELGVTNVRYNRETVESGQRRQAVGLATSFEVLQFQTNLANARSQLLRSIIDYNRAIIQLEAAKGTLLDTLCVHIAQAGGGTSKKGGRESGGRNSKTITTTTKKPAASAD